MGFNYFAKIVFATLLLLIFYPAHVLAEIKPGSIELGLSAGEIFFDPDADDNSFQFSLSLGANISKHVGVELSLLNSFDSLSDSPTASFIAANTAFKFLPDADINPYLIVGVGSGSFGDGSNNHSRFTASGGAGVYFSYWKNVALRLDLRDYMTFNDITHNFATSLGIMYVFDFTEIVEPAPRPVEGAVPYRPGAAEEAQPVSRPLEAEGVEEPGVEKAKTAPEPTAEQFEPIEEEAEPMEEITEPFEETPAPAPTPAEPAIVAPVPSPAAPVEEETEPIEEIAKPMEEITEPMEEPVEPREEEREVPTVSGPVSTAPATSTVAPTVAAVPVVPAPPPAVEPAEKPMTPAPSMKRETASPAVSRPAPNAEPAPKKALRKPSEVIENAETAPLYKLHVLHKGAMLGIDFPFKSSEITSKSFDLLLELIAYMKTMTVKSIHIVPLSSEYESIQEISDIGQERASRIIDMFERNSTVDKDLFTIVAPDRVRLRKFYDESEGRTNRVYIVVSFE